MNVKKLLLKLLKVLTIIAGVVLVIYGLFMWMIYAAMNAKPVPSEYRNSRSVRASIDSNRFIALFTPVADRNNPKFVSDSLQIESLLFEHYPDSQFVTMVVIPKPGVEYGRNEYVVNVRELKTRYQNGHPPHAYIFPTTADTIHRDTISIEFWHAHFEDCEGCISSPYNDYDRPLVRVKFKRVYVLDAYLREEAIRMESESWRTPGQKIWTPWDEKQDELSLDLQ